MNKGKPRAQGSQTAQQMAFSWLLYFGWHLSKGFSATLHVSPAVVAGTRGKLPVWMCWGASDAEAIHPPFSSLSLTKENRVWKFLHLPEKLTTSSVQFNGFQSPMKNTGQREFGNFFICLLFLLSCVCVCVCVCVCWKLQKKLEGKKLKRNISYKSWIAYSPLTIRCMYFQTFPYVCVVFWKTGMCTILFLFWNLTFFFNSTYGPLAMCEHIEKKFILFHCLTVFHNKDVV